MCRFADALNSHGSNLSLMYIVDESAGVSIVRAQQWVVRVPK